ncbi:hypothetical protein BOX15_Mlig033791g2, partial [Macrostomum lignano]
STTVRYLRQSALKKFLLSSSSLHQTQFCYKSLAAISKNGQRRDMSTEPSTATASAESTSLSDAKSAELASAGDQELEPCILGLFAGKVNKNLTIYPELDSVEEIDAVHKTVEPVEKFFEEHVNSSELDTQAEFLPPPLLAGLRQLNLFNTASSLSAVAQARLSECLSADASIELTLRAHNSLGVRALLEGAKPELLHRLGGALASGERIAAFCLTEPCGGGAFAQPKSAIQCKATLDTDGCNWRLNGTKIWVANAPVADAFVVLAATDAPAEKPVTDSASDKRRTGITAFLVERDQPGVSVGPREVGLGVRSAAVGALHLNNVIVSDASVLGELGEGHRLVRRVVTAGRIAAGAAAVGSLKRQIGQVAEQCKVRRTGGLPPLAEYPMVQRRLARMAGMTYTAESVTYLLAFLSDQFPEADLSPEAAALQLLSSRAAVTGATDVAALAGGRSVASLEFPYERQLRDALTLAGVDSSPDTVRLQLSGRGVKYAASVAADSAYRFLSARSVLSKWRIMNEINVAGETHNLAVHWHHSLAGIANTLEIHIGAFTRAVRGCLFYYREDLPKQQLLMQRIADCSVDIFTLIACCARASRSKSIGLRSADIEMDLVTMLSKEASVRLENNLAGLDIERLYTRHADSEFGRISDFTCKFGGYAVDHAVSRNWN